MVACVGLTGVLAGCDDQSRAAEQTTLTVFAASSLTRTFGELEAAFEKERPGLDVIVSSDSSTALAEQITQGAPADVIATADLASLQLVLEAQQLAKDPLRFASNTMALVTPPDNPADIRSVEDLQGTDFVVCDPSAPCGAAAADILEQVGVGTEAKSLEPKVTAVLARVTLGEADAGIVYVTDAQAAGSGVTIIDIPADDNVVNPYYIAPVKDAAASQLADEWIGLVTSRAGQDVLANAGFGPP